MVLHPVVVHAFEEFRGSSSEEGRQERNNKLNVFAMSWRSSEDMMMICLSSIAMGAICFLLYSCYVVLWGKQEGMRWKLKQQGIGGPPPAVLYGNIEEMKKIKRDQSTLKGSRSAVLSNYALTLFPYFDQWKKKYGSTFTYATGSIQVLYVTQPDLVKEIGQYKSPDLGKPTYLQKEMGLLFGNGVMTSNGDTWANQRKVIAPEFFLEKVKGMIDMMVGAADIHLGSWERVIECQGGEAEVIVDHDLRKFTADVISKACFGSSYSEGEKIFIKLRDLQQALSESGMLIGIPGTRYLPTKKNRDMWKLNREIQSMILRIVKKRRDNRQGSEEKDLLQGILDNVTNGCLDAGTAERYIVDNCKNIYFAGHDTTAISATWCLMLLALHPDWQTRVRAEVVEICRGQLPDANMLKSMKVLTTVIHETLRIYPVGAFATRETLASIRFGELLVPKGINIRIPIFDMHHDPEIWGLDVHQFKPERFSHGISRACKLPHAYMPFGLGPRTCLGQNLAMVELKIILSLILSRFTFSLSPKYLHSPAFRLTVEPEFGVPLKLCKFVST